jgi:hypothetical protein
MRPIDTISQPEPEMDFPDKKREKKKPLHYYHHLHLVIMGVQKKTRKFALAKRAISMRDNRLFVAITKQSLVAPC